MHLFGPEDCAAGVSGPKSYHGFAGEVDWGPATLSKAAGKPAGPLLDRDAIVCDGLHRLSVESCQTMNP
jgi:hypothetical protein